MNRLFRALGAAKVDYVLVGGLAARAHGSARVTQDIDICYDRSAANLARLVQALARFKPYLRDAPAGLPFEWSVRTLSAGLNFTLTTTGGDIDLLGELVGGGTYATLLPHATTVRVFGQSVRVLDLDWLIRVKRAAGRPRDLEVIAELEALKRERDRGAP